MSITSIRRVTGAFALGALIAAIAILTAPGVSAQAPQTSIAYVNGTSAEPIDVDANGTIIPGLAFATASPSAVSGAGGYDVRFGDGSAVLFEAEASVAYTVVSGFGDEEATAAAYAIAAEAIPDGQAIVTVWNATTENQLFSVDGSDPFELLPGEGLEPALVAAGSTVTIQVGSDIVAALAVTAEPDSRTDVFAVSDGEGLALAPAVIPSMTALVEAIGSTPELPTVPDVVGLGADEAAQTLDDAGFSVQRQDEPSGSVEAGIVISTDPVAGTEAVEGTTVLIVVSAGPATVAVPDVVGATVADAQAAIEEAGLIAVVEERADDDVEAGLVIETNPRAGVEVAPGTEVVTVVSTGPEDVEVPDLLGLTVDEAAPVVEESGLAIEVVLDPDDPDPEGLVVEQTPAAGEVVEFGSTVTVLLSPAIGEAWTSIKLDPDRTLTAGGINFEVDSISEVSVLSTDLSGRAVVDERGYWIIEIDTTSLDPNAAYEVLVTGTAADGSDYEQVFNLPPPGESIDVPEDDDDGIPVVVFIVLGLVLLVAILLGVLLVREAMATRAADAAAAAEPAVDEPPATD